jgi:hypothetical protein
MMPRYHSRPKEIDAVQFDPRKQPPEGVKIRSVNGGYEVWNELHGSWIGVKEGDMLRIDLAPRDVYPIDKATFDQTYDSYPER